MSRRAAIVEEFDDDTDLPLPSHPLPNTGTKGPLLEEIHISDDEFEPSARAGPASSLPAQGRPAAQPGEPENRNTVVTDITPYKAWTCIYPIYIDAKRPYGTGQRRVKREESVWWPLSKDIADATTRLGLGTLHEVNKTHPRDWENPGRVRVQWKKNGKLVNPLIKTKKELLELICFQIHQTKPENAPKQPYTYALPKPTTAIPSSKIAAKGKAQPPKPPKSSATAMPKSSQGRRPLPCPPDSQQPLASRVSPYSPAVSQGILVETVKAGMVAQEAGTGALPPGQAPAGGAAKGKRKVVRVRG